MSAMPNEPDANGSDGSLELSAPHTLTPSRSPLSIDAAAPRLHSDRESSEAAASASEPEESDEDYQLHPHSFLPNVLRNWLWSRPPRRSVADSLIARAQQAKLRCAQSCAQDSSTTPTTNTATNTAAATTVDRRPSLTHGSSLALPSPSLAASPLPSNRLGLFRPGSISQRKSSDPCCCTRPATLRLGQRSLRKVQAGGGVSNPSSFRLDGALLFVDMSGFTPLSERLGEDGMIGVEALSRHLNDYFGPIVTMIESFNGDVIKFAGDALMVLFSANPFEEDPAAAAAPPSLADLVCRAVACGEAVHRQFDGFSPVEGITLKLHSAISAGPMYACVVGGAFDRYEFLLQGSAIFDLASAMNEARVGDIILADSAYQCARELLVAQEVRVRSPESAKTPTPAAPVPVPTAPRPKFLRRTASEANASTAPPVGTAPAPSLSVSPGPALNVPFPGGAPVRPVSVWRFERLLVTLPTPHAVEAAVPLDPPPLQSRALSLEDPLVIVRGISGASNASSGDRKNSTSLSASRGSDAPFGFGLSPMHCPSGQQSSSPSRLAANNTASAASAFLIPGVLARVQDGQGEYLAEFRRVTTLFIGLPTLPTHSLDTAVHLRALAELSHMVCAIMSIIFTSRGEIRQLITDDKGTVVIAVFGLLSHTHNPLRGLKAAADILDKLRTKGHQVNVGITTGQVFCGCIGTVHRCEYAFIGDRINTAARLMVASQRTGAAGILSDDETLKTISLGPASAITASLLAHEALNAAVESSQFDRLVAHVKHGLHFQQRAPLTLKGKKQPFPVWAVGLAVKQLTSRVRSNSGRMLGAAMTNTATTDANNADGTPNPASTLTSPGGVPPQQAFRRSAILHDLHIRPLAVSTSGSRHGDVSNDDLVGRRFELAMLKLRLVQACLDNGAECRRRKRREAVVVAKAEAEVARQQGPKRAFSLLDSGLKQPAAGGVVDATVSSTAVSHGVIFLESVAGFGKSALLASLVECCSRTGARGLTYAPLPYLELRLEPLVACADEFSQSVPYFTARTLVRCVLASLYRLARRGRRARTREDREQQREEAYTRQQEADTAAQRLGLPTPTGTSSLNSAPSTPSSTFSAPALALGASSLPSTIDVDADSDLDLDDEDESVDTINLDTYSFRDLSLLDLPAGLACMQHLYLLNEVVPGLKLPYVPPNKYHLSKFHRLGSMSDVTDRDADTESEEEEEDADDEEEDDHLGATGDDADGETHVNADLAELDSTGSVTAPVPSSGSDSDTEVISTPSSSEADSEDDVMSTPLRAMHPHIQRHTSARLQQAAMPHTRTATLARRRSLTSSLPLTPSSGVGSAQQSTTSADMAGSDVLMPLPQSNSFKTRAGRSVRKPSRVFFTGGEIEPTSFSVFVSPPAHDDNSQAESETGGGGRRRRHSHSHDRHRQGHSHPHNSHRPAMLRAASAASSGAHHLTSTTGDTLAVSPVGSALLSPGVRSPGVSPSPASPASSPDDVSRRKAPYTPTPPLMSAAAKSEAIESTVVELISTLLDQLHAADFLSLLTPSPRRSNVGIFIDNAQWMDASSLTLLKAIQRVLPSVICVFAGRNFSRNLQLLGKHERLKPTTDDVPTTQPTLHTSASSNYLRRAPTVAATNTTAGARPSSSAGSQLVRTAQNRGCIYVVRGEDVERELEEKRRQARPKPLPLTPSQSPSDSPLLSSSASPAAVISPEADAAEDDDFHIESIFNLDYFDCIPSRLTPVQDLRSEEAVVPEQDPLTSTGGLTRKRPRLSRAARRRLRGRAPLVISAMESVEDDPTRDFRNSLLLRVCGLSCHDLAELICRRYRATSVAPEVIDFIHAKSNGSPLYADQMMQAMLAREMVAVRPTQVTVSAPIAPAAPAATTADAVDPSKPIQADDHDRGELDWSEEIRAQGGLAWVNVHSKILVTESIEDLIGQRLDALAPSQQLLLKVCSVFGLEVRPEAVLRVILAHDIRHDGGGASGTGHTHNSAHPRFDRTSSTSSDESTSVGADSPLSHVHASPHTRNVGFGTASPHTNRPSFMRASTAGVPPASVGDSSPTPFARHGFGTLHVTAANSPTEADPTTGDPLTLAPAAPAAVELPQFVASRVKDFDALLASEILRWDRGLEAGASESSGSGSDKEEDPNLPGAMVLRGMAAGYAAYLSSLQALVPTIHRRIYSFTHALTRDVVYTRLPFSYRAAFHRACAEWYTERYAANLTPHLPKLSLHWLASARCEQSPQQRVIAFRQALQYLVLAGQNATAKYAAKEALEYFTEARSILPNVYPSPTQTDPSAPPLHPKLNARDSDTNTSNAPAVAPERVPIARQWKEVELLEFMLPCVTIVRGVPASLSEYQYMLALVEELHGIPSKEAQENRKAARYQRLAQERELRAKDEAAPTGDGDEYDSAAEDEDDDGDDDPATVEVSPDEVQSLLFISLLGVATALSNGPAWLGKVANVRSKVCRLVALATRLDNSVYSTDALLQAIMCHNFSGDYVEAAQAGLKLVDIIDQAFVVERAKAKKEIKAAREAKTRHAQEEHAAAVAAAHAHQAYAHELLSVEPIEPSVPPPPSGGLMRQVSEASSAAQERVEASLTSTPSLFNSPSPSRTPHTASASKMAVRAIGNIFTTMRPRSVYSPTMGGRMMTAWALCQLGHVRLSLDLVAQLQLIAQRLSGSHVGMQAAGARRLLMGYLQDPQMTLLDATKQLQAVRASGHAFGIFSWELALNLIKCREGDAAVRRDIMVETWKKLDDGHRLSTMFSWLVCNILSFTAGRSSYLLGLKYTSNWWSHSFQAREETNMLPECFRYRAACWRQVWRERHTAAQSQAPYHQHRCSGAAETATAAASALPLLARSEYRFDLPTGSAAAALPPPCEPAELPCSVILTHMFSCLFRAVATARAQSARFLELRAFLALLDTLDEVEHGICVEVRGGANDTWEPDRSKRCACAVGQRFVQLTHELVRATMGGPSTHEYTGVQTTCMDESDAYKTLRQRLRVDEYALYELLRGGGVCTAPTVPPAPMPNPAAATAANTAALAQAAAHSPFLSFLVNLRSRAYVSVRSLFMLTVRPVNLAATTDELRELEQAARDDKKRRREARAAAAATAAAAALATKENATDGSLTITISPPPSFSSPPPAECPLHPPPALLPLPRFSPSDRLADYEIFQVAMMRLEDARARAQWSNKRSACGLEDAPHEYQPAFTRHARKFPI